MRYLECSRDRQGRKAAALVLTLFFIVLISALVMTLLFSMRLDRSTTESYSQAARVQELASGALEEILADLKAEIVAGSREEAAFTVQEKRVFAPRSARTSQPARIGYLQTDYATDVHIDLLPPSLIRVSRAEVDPAVIFPATDYNQAKLPPQRASAVSTDIPSTNGKSISAKRWNAPFLMGETPPKRFEDNLPDWIYFSRSGSQVYLDADIQQLKPNRNLDLPEPVLGRYAYVIYDAGSLLDMNAAGYPNSLAGESGGPAAIRGKSSLLFSALQTLPGLAGNPTRLAALDELVTWRNKGSIATAGGFKPAAEEWERSGFTEVKPGDNPLLSRGDLIDYFTKKVGSKAPLAYLGTFSRHLSAPSARPATPTDPNLQNTAYDYNKNADLPASVNRDLANVRFAQDSTVTHYDDEAVAHTYNVTEGDPLLQARFSLARLGWLTKADPSTGTAPNAQYGQAIKSAFGLVWDYPGGSAGSSSTANGGNKCWNYYGAAGDPLTFNGKIKTLDQVASEGREPDFFELLKAAILSGSIGKGPGEAAFNNGRNVEGFNKDYYYPWGDDNLKSGTAGFYCHTFGPFSTVPAPARIPDIQIMRIGANIIDQFDSDSYPTAIYFKYQEVADNDPVSGSSGNPIFGPVTMAYGIENLPYLQSIRQILASPNRSSSGTPGNGTDLTTNTFGGWRQPYLWNPHQPPAEPFQNRPATYQIRAYGSSCMTKWQWPGAAATAAGKTYTWGLSYAVDYYMSNSNTEACDVGTINFTLADSTSPTAFTFQDKPYPLVQNGLSNVSATSPAPGNLGKSTMAFYDENMPAPYNLPNHFVGFSTGVTPTDPTAPEPYKPFYVSNANGLGGQGRPELGANTYVLGWLDAMGKFHPYSFITGAFTFEGFKLEKPEQRVGTANPERGVETWMQADPRTDRFSLARGIQAYNLSSTITVYRGNNSRWHASARPRTEAGFIGMGYPWQVYSFAWGDMMVNSKTDATHTNYYTDPDGVVRPGDGYYATPGTGDGLMTFVTNGAPTGTPVSAGDKTSTSHGRRPVVLNRPFRSVAELGYVFRDQPFKTLDFFTDKSADTALLDIFALHDLAIVSPDKLIPIAGGRVNLNAASKPVLAALLKGGAKKEGDLTYDIKTEADGIATGMANRVLKDAGGKYAPIASIRDLIPALVEETRKTVTTSPDKGNKTYLEAPLRAISESTDFRTWNLMIDLIAQTGRFTPNAQNLSKFSVEGERRVWLHVAIDRYTGEVIARQVEPVYE